MPWIAPIVGGSTNKGYLYCQNCVIALCVEVESTVKGDQYFGPDDKCESCGSQLRHTPSTEYEHVSW